MDKEDIVGISLVALLFLLVGWGGWWMSVGAYRSEYRFCVGEYMKSYPNDQKGSFNHCYDQTF